VVHPSREVLQAFDSGVLSHREWDAVERHIAQCTVCCQTLEGMEDTLASLMRSVRVRPDTMVYGDTPNGSAPFAPVVAEVPPELAEHARYRILDLVGSGGMGVVFRAEHRLMERLVALKILNKALTSRPGGVERFQQEVKMAAKLSHPNIVTAYDADQAGEVHFLVTELVDGTSLERLLSERGPVSVPDACEWVRQAAVGLQHAFERGMVHRDIKPANLLLTPQGQVKILDFGLARFLSESSGVSPLTQSATLVGTPDFVAPEQARDPRSADIRADIYSLGCTLYNLLSGRVPFPEGTLLQKLISHQEAEPIPVQLLRPEVPDELVDVMDRMMAKDRERRYRTPQEVAEALAPFTSAAVPLPVTPKAPLPTRTLAWLFGGFGAAAIAASVLIIALAYRKDPADSRNAGVQVANREVPELQPLPKAQPEGPAIPPAKLPEPGAAPVDPMVEWVRNNNAFGPEHLMVRDVARKRDEAGQRGFMFYLGPQLVRNQRLTVLTTIHKSFLVLELPKEQSGAIPAKSALAQTVSTKDERMSADPQFQLGNPVIESANAHDASQQIKGKVAIRRLHKGSGLYALRLKYVLGTNTYTMYSHIKEDLEAFQGERAFTFEKMNYEGPRRVGPIILLIDLCRFDGPDRRGAVLVESNVVPAIVNLTAPAGEKTLPAIEFK
jgi:serine/threonine protein kinase